MTWAMGVNSAIMPIASSCSGLGVRSAEHLPVLEDSD
jgi:hypothetical protein